MTSPAPTPPAATAKVSIGVDMRNIERKAAGEPLHEFLTTFRVGFAAASGAMLPGDLKKEMVRRRGRGSSLLCGGTGRGPGGWPAPCCRTTLEGAWWDGMEGWYGVMAWWDGMEGWQVPQAGPAP